MGAATATATAPPRRAGRSRPALRSALVGSLLPLVAVLALLASLLVPGGALSGLAGGGPTVSLVAPDAVAVGEPLVVEVRLTGGREVAGVELDLALDAGAAGVDGVDLSAGPFGDRAVLALPVARRADGLSLGVHACPAAGCADPLPTTAQPAVLAALPLAPARAGVHEVRIDAVRAVAADGRALPVDVGTGSLRIAVGDAPRLVAAPPVSAEPTAVDVTVPGDPEGQDRSLGVLTADWLLARERGPACEPEASGCVDVGDLVAAAARTGRADGLALRAAATGTTLTVTSTGDQTDAAPGDGECRSSAGTCTLRAAIAESNALAGHDTIAFAIPGTGPHTIRPASRFPYVADSAGVTIDGYTQPGAVPNSHPARSDAVLKVAVRGTGSAGIDGLILVGPDNVVRGLSMYQYRRSVWMLAGDSRRNAAVGNWIGIDPAAGGASGIDDTAVAVLIQNGASDNQVGGPDPADRNVLSGNGDHGVAFYNSGTARNVVQGNIVGLSPDGTRAIPNHSHGIDINTGTTDTLVGGDAPGEANVLSGNRGEGIEISHNAGTKGNAVVGNLVGTGPDGAPAPHAGNAFRGIHLEGGPPILGPNTVRGNVVVGNALGGVLIDRGVEGTTVTGNRIGVTAAGVVAGNGEYGVRLQSGASRNTVGPDNTIVGNAAGVQLRTQGFVEDTAQTWDNTVTRNVIAGNGSGPGIDLEPLGTADPNDAGDADSGANTQLNTPVLAADGPTTVSGTACAGCRVELFEADAAGQRPGAAGSGERFLGAVTADGAGGFSATVDGVAGRFVTSTATSPAGSTSEFSRNVRLPDPPPDNAAPVPSSTVTCTGLECAADGSASTDPDGSVVAWSWAFGDGATASGATVSHRYQAAGTYSVRLTVTDDAGATATTTRSVAVAPPPGQVVEDRFQRTAATGWGRAETGGTWSVPYAVEQLSVSGGTGRLALDPGSSRIATLPTAQVRDTDTTVAVSLDRAPGGDGAYVYLLARQNRDLSTQYRTRLRLSGDGSVLVGVSVVDGSEAEAYVGPDRVVDGLAVEAGARYLVRQQVTGVSPTRVRTKVWRDGAPEPTAWAVSVTDSTPSLQRAGAVGVRAYLTDTAAPLVVSVDDLRVRDLVAAPLPPNEPPAARASAACDDLACSFDGSASADADGEVATWSWDFGDGTTATGPTATHAYAAAGTYTVRLTVTDDEGATATRALGVTVTEPPPPPGPEVGDVVAADAFTRTRASGWGSADTGGVWTLTSPRQFSTADGAGVVSVPVRASRLAELRDVSVRDVDVRVRLTLDAAPTGGGFYGYVLTRRTADLTSYRTRVRLMPDGRVRLGVTRTAGAQAETVVLADRYVPKLTLAPGAPVEIRVRAVGASPTTLEAKVWAAGTPEPSTWQLTGTDATPELQAAGGIGLRAYTSGSSTQPVVLRVDDLRAVVAE